MSEIQENEQTKGTEKNGAGHIFDVIDGFIDWLDLILWHLGNATICLLKFNLDGAIETMQWLQIHLTYSGKKLYTRKLPIKRRIQNVMIKMVGWLVFVGIGYLINQSIKMIL